MDSFQFNLILLCTVNTAFIFLGVFLNSVVIMSLQKSELRRKLCYFMIIILACLDLVVVVFSHSLIAVSTIRFYLFNEHIHGALDTALSAVRRQLVIFSLSVLLTLTIERYVSVVYPLFHRKVVTKSKLMAVFVLLQLPFSIIHLTFRFRDNVVHFNASALASSGTLFLMLYYLNFRIFYVARTTRRGAIAPAVANFNNRHEQGYIETRKHFTVLPKNISTCLLAVLCISLCFLPHMVFRALTLALGIDWEDTTYHLWVDTLQILNSTFNCLIFFYKNRTLRRHGKEILAKYFSKRKQDRG